jgi:pre-mRNA-processing factor 17
MSLVQGYSSDEDDGSLSLTSDAFGLSRLQTAKKIRVEEPRSPLQPQAAPHVLAEVAHP